MHYNINNLLNNHVCSYTFDSRSVKLEAEASFCRKLDASALLRNTCSFSSSSPLFGVQAPALDLLAIALRRISVVPVVSPFGLGRQSAERILRLGVLGPSCSSHCDVTSSVTSPSPPSQSKSWPSMSLEDSDDFAKIFWIVIWPTTSVLRAWVLVRVARGAACCEFRAAFVLLLLATRSDPVVLVLYDGFSASALPSRSLWQITLVLGSDSVDSIFLLLDGFAPWKRFFVAKKSFTRACAMLSGRDASTSRHFDHMTQTYFLFNHNLKLITNVWNALHILGIGYRFYDQCTN